MGDKRIREVFNVEAGRRAYMAFIDHLRDQLKGNRLVGDRPVLPTSEEATISDDPRFEIVLQTNKPSEITLLLRRHDLYMEAYRNGSGTWLEFSTPNQVEHVIQGSEFLGFHGSYTASQGIEAAAGRGRDCIRLGRDDLRDAVNNLAASDDREERARSLIVIIQMTVESIRLDEVLFFSLDNYVEGRGGVPGPLLLELENSWGILSKCLGYEAHDEDINFFPMTYRDGITQRRFITRKQAIGALGMLSSAVKSINVHTRVPRSLNTFQEDFDSAVDVQTSGRPLADVYLLEINELTNEFLGRNMYGTITVTDRERTQSLYNRGRSDAEEAKKGKFIYITGPSEACISASDDFHIDVNIKDTDILSNDDAIGMGRFTWSPKNSDNVYDMGSLESREFSGNAGNKLKIHYMVYRDAVQAHFEIKLIDGDHEKRPDVYGYIAATPTSLGPSSHLVFNRDRGSAAAMRPQQLLPLIKPVLAVPLHSPLRIYCKLFDRDRNIFDTDDLIAFGEVTWLPQPPATFKHIIEGDYGSIEVKVVWKP
ncbi:uncharacterized protein LOC141684880 [Apium graveolens]|uniref:uncharacterized protein LOC141684880 n=1 Tax=Apium graveolens TaxID=4045 RepID=UPI003D7A6D45